MIPLGRIRFSLSAGHDRYGIAISRSSGRVICPDNPNLIVRGYEAIQLLRANAAGGARSGRAGCYNGWIAPSARNRKPLGRPVRILAVWGTTRHSRQNAYGNALGRVGMPTRSAFLAVLSGGQSGGQ